MRWRWPSGTTTFAGASGSSPWAAATPTTSGPARPADRAAPRRTDDLGRYRRAALSVDALLAALKAGRCFVSASPDGPQLYLSRPSLDLARVRIVGASGGVLMLLSESRLLCLRADRSGRHHRGRGSSGRGKLCPRPGDEPLRQCLGDLESDLERLGAVTPSGACGYFARSAGTDGVALVAVHSAASDRTCSVRKQRTVRPGAKMKERRKSSTRNRP